MYDLRPLPLVTLLLGAVTLAAFVLLALSAGRGLEIDSSRLLAWGAAYGPLALRGEGWRLLSSLFLHASLAHLAFNLCFLLLIGQVAERLLGPLAFLCVYLFAGIGGGLLAVGWFPTAVQVGASGAVFGVYGALAGCCLRGWRVVPRQVLCWHVVVLLLLAGSLLVNQFLLREESLIAHLGGALCGLAAGVILGSSCHRRGRARELLRLGVFLLLGGLATWGLGRLADRGARRPVEMTVPIEAARTREREILARFDAAMELWDDGELTDKGLARRLEKDFIPRWRRMRKECDLLLPGEDRLARPVLSQLRQLELPKQEDPGEEPTTAEEVKDLFRVYSKARLEAWTSLAATLRGEKASFDDLTNLLVVELLRLQIEELVNEDNPLRDWVAFSPARLREKKLDRNRRSGRREK